MTSYLLAGPSAEPVTLAEAKAFLRVDGDAEDAFIANLITAARLHVEGTTGKALIAQTWRVVLDAWPADRTVNLPVSPLMTLTTITAYDDEGDGTELALAQFLPESKTSAARLLLPATVAGMPHSRARAGIEIDYVAGYATEAEAVPADLKQAALRLVGYWFEHRDAVVIAGSGAVVPEIVAGANGLVAARAGEAVATVSIDACVDDGHVAVSRKRPDSSENIGQLALTYLDRDESYRSATATAVALSGDAGSALNSGLVVDTPSARRAAERVLANGRVAGGSLELALPNAMLALEVGDVIEVDGQSDGPFLITELRDTTCRRITARAVSGQTGFAVFDTERSAGDAGVPAIGAPLVMAAHLPAAQGTLAPSRLMIGAVCKPWPGELTVTAADTGTTLARLTKAATLGELTAPLHIADAPVWDRKNAIALKIYDGHPSSVSRTTALAGDNRLAVQAADSHWEIIGFSDAELTGDGEYRLTGLLRGLMGTGDAMAERPAGARVMVLDGAVAEVGVNAEWLGGTFELRAFAGSKDVEGTAASARTDTDPLLDLAPCHLAATREDSTGEVTLTWTRRGRLNGNSWALAEIPMNPVPEAYRVEIHDGERLVRSVAAPEPMIVYPAAEQTADFGLLPSSFTFTVAQTSPTLGPGHIATGAFNG